MLTGKMITSKLTDNYRILYTKTAGEKTLEARDLETQSLFFKFTDDHLALKVN